MNNTDPTQCPHTNIVRIANSWQCVQCGAPFKPVNPKHETQREKPYTEIHQPIRY